MLSLEQGTNVEKLVLFSGNKLTRPVILGQG